MISPEQRRVHPEVAKLKTELFTRPLPEEYESLVNMQAFIELPSQFSRATFNTHSERVEELVKDNDVFDLGCGQDSWFRPMVDESAARYIGIDKSLLKPFEKWGETPLYGLQGDILDLVSRIESDPESKKTFILSGIDAMLPLPGVKTYLIALQTELSRICQPGDKIVIGAGTIGFNLEEYGFESTYQNKEFGEELEVYAKK